MSLLVGLSTYGADAEGGDGEDRENEEDLVDFMNCVVKVLFKIGNLLLY